MEAMAWVDKTKETDPIIRTWHLCFFFLFHFFPPKIDSFSGLIYSVQSIILIISKRFSAPLFNRTKEGKFIAKVMIYIWINILIKHKI